MCPTNHTLIITIPGVKRVTGRIISVKPMGPGVAQLVVETVDVLPYGAYEAVYTTPGSPWARKLPADTKSTNMAMARASVGGHQASSSARRELPVS